MRFRLSRFSLRTLLLIIIAAVCIAAGGTYSFADDSENTAQTQSSEPGDEVSKKGIQIVDGNYPLLVDIQDIGVSYGFLNFFYNELVSTEPTEYFYDYKGKTCTMPSML